MNSSNDADVVVIEGDGIGPEVVDAAMRCAQAACSKYGKSIHWLSGVAGEKAVALYGNPLPQETIELIKQHRYCLKGPMNTPLGEGYTSPNVRLRKALDLYQCVRPVRKLPNVWSPLANPDGIDIVLFRENTEDLYAGEEYATDATDPRSTIECQTYVKSHGFADMHRSFVEDGAIGIKRITRKGCERIVRAAFEYAVKHGRKRVTATAKPNIMKCTDGLFKRVADAVAKEYDGRVAYNFLIVDNCLAKLISWPQGFDVLVTLNLYGDILSDGAAALVGGLGVAPGANIGTDYAVFEAVHGTAPDIPPTAGNPTAITLSGAMLLEHLGWEDAATTLRNAVEATLAEGKVLTGDLLPREKRHLAATSSAFGNEVIRHI